MPSVRNWPFIICCARLGKEATVYNQDGTPENYQFLPGSDRIVHELPPLESFDVAFILDCSELERVGREAARIAAIPNLVEHRSPRLQRGILRSRADRSAGEFHGRADLPARRAYGTGGDPGDGDLPLYGHPDRYGGVSLRKHRSGHPSGRGGPGGRRRRSPVDLGKCVRDESAGQDPPARGRSSHLDHRRRRSCRIAHRDTAGACRCRGVAGAYRRFCRSSPEHPGGGDFHPLRGAAGRTFQS